VTGPGPDELSALAALVSRQAADLEVYAGFVFAALDGALPPGMVRIERKQSLADRLRGREGVVVSASVRLGEQRFVLQRSGVGASSEALVVHEVGGIVLSRRALPLADWSRQLTAALAELAGQNAVAAGVLRRLSSFTV